MNKPTQEYAVVFEGVTARVIPEAGPKSVGLGVVGTF